MRMHTYPLTAEVLRTSGRVFKKVAEGKGGWVPRARWVAAYKRIKGCENGEVQENQRVYHMDGDPMNDDPSNLAAITFSGYKYRLKLKTSKPIYIPNAERANRKMGETYKMKTAIAV